jgi:hypothetical protein
MTRAATISLGALFVVAGCDDPVDEPLGYRSKPPAIATMDAGLTCGDVPSRVFAKSCTGCHDAARSEGGLDLVSPGAGARISGRPAMSGGLLADPAHPAESVVYARLLGKRGALMPMGGPPLDADAIACVLSWIQSLAPPPSNGGSEPGHPPVNDGTPTGSPPVVAAPGDDAGARPTIRISAGASAGYTDQAGQTWAADSGFSAGQVASNAPPVAIAATNEDALYNHERWGGDGGGNFIDFRYTFSVPNGAYRLTLKFAETYSEAMGTGLRRFDVAVGGTKVLTDFDIFASAGANTAVDKTFDVTVSGGQLVVDFQRGGALTPKIDAIEVIPR